MNIHTASKNGDTEAVLLFLDRGFDINSRNEDQNTPLQLTICAGHIDLARLLLSRGAAPDSTTLRFTLYRADVGLATELLRSGVDPNFAEDGLTPLILACGLLEDSSGAPLHICSANFGFLHRAEEEEAFCLSRPSRSALPLTERLLAAGSQINACGLRGHTPLHSAALANNTDVITFLLTNGADPTIRDRSGETPRGRAVQAKRKEASLLLRELSSP